MALVIFGTTIEIVSTPDSELIKDLVNLIVKRSEERKLLLNFLSQNSVRGQTRFTEIEENSRERTGNKNNRAASLESVSDFYIAEMKRRKTNGGISIYNDLVYSIIERENPRLKIHITRLKRGKVQITDLPKTFPANFKLAETLIFGKLRSEIGTEEYEEYFKRKELIASLQLIAGDMFFGINNGLTGETLDSFMGLMYELGKIQTALPTNNEILRRNILESLSNNCPLNLIHIKCLRFTYPFGKNLVLLSDLEDHEVPDKSGGIHCPLGERNLFSKLEHIAALFGKFGISVDLLVLLSDQDLRDYFPDGGAGVVPDEDIRQAYTDLSLYKEAIRKALRNGRVEYLRNYLKEIGQEEIFDKTRTKTLSELNNGISYYSESFVEERVNYRFESNTRILANRPKNGRQFARSRVHAQLASMKALGVLKNQQGNLILIEEDRGDENQFIGGRKNSALPVYFTKLRE